ncbi:Glucosyltransferase-like protein [Puccinia graminis f. sp. tritici]|uniref:Uncharacterized protein n=2 Tax=Puccinia graminis f. sp. tritici TaxID=56615 RepID=E3K1V1_PUCGT|nr:uncharacterized protein PGTG_04232 [Puccinia graminis f. sp. tritici CRL 75-36-700-3]XP_003327969.2 uncharacterized protein PGTG_08736 [Puccinia graminis f. sp. tritici CRL 75-36-700-3]EFP78276.2 hypothetical protein PGTG_04232 [Puccinia graminis f. sp. tritici CRL 75-36-700-3]EFP83550.2 hypothetical protein PGTG_08736 [Puccinia graminis f. sp. tritici CRL 75-36-700-3]KAA1112790.1 Glucosyltransferase-like protein [Puccinia graminis f. sp. tritici]
MLKVGPLPQRMLKEPAGSGNRASSHVMISSLSGKKPMNQIKNRLHVAKIVEGLVAAVRARRKRTAMSSTIRAGTRLMGDILITPPEGPLNTITPHIADREVLLHLAVVQEFWDGLGALVARYVAYDLRSLSVDKNAEIAGFLGSSAQIPV